MEGNQVEEDDRYILLGKPLEYESCALPIEEGKTTLCLEYNIDPDVHQPTMSQQFQMFDNRNRLYKYTPKDLVRNGELIDQDIRHIDSDVEIPVQGAKDDEGIQIIKLNKVVFEGAFSFCNSFDRSKVKKGQFNMNLPIS